MSALRCKYIIVDAMGFEFPIILPETVQHAQAINLHEKTPIAAGFFTLTDMGVAAYGESVSLHVPSRPQDAEIIERTLRLLGFPTRSV